MRSYTGSDLTAHSGFRLRTFTRMVLQAGVLLVAGLAMAQTGPDAGKESPAAPAVDVLGAHSISGRGCLGCHAPHISSSASEAGYRANFPLWGESGAPAYGATITFGEAGQLIEAAPASLMASDPEVRGILLCLSCHDGNITPQNMMAGQSYEQRVGLLPFVRSLAPVPTLMGNELVESFARDHPLGVDAKIEVGNGLEFVNGTFSVKPGTPYARFVENYGWPTLAPMRRSNPYGIDEEGNPYLVCTTCHNQHAMSVYVAGPGSPIQGSGEGEGYTTYFFVNGPYSPNIYRTDQRISTSNMQFCRQCHFSIANEGNNTRTIPTLF